MSNIIFTLSEIGFSMPKNWIISAFRSLFAFFDFLVYTIIEILFRAVFNLANFELYGVYEDIMERVYVILGIFMLFKITISLITYLADPDKISDKQEGISKLITRVIVVMVMLIGLPTFFSLMTEAQNKLIPVIPRVIINSPNVLSSDDVSGISSNLATTMLSGFAHVKDGCNNPGISKPYQILSVVNDSCQSSSGDNSNYYAYDYLPIVSTLTGIMMVYVIFSFCISVAIRAFKLIILRSIAPIPVLSYIDPKSSKDGAFSTWRKTFFSTWLELFINLAIIYFIIYIIDMLLSGDMYKGFFDGVNFIDGIFLFAFLIIGLMMFAKEAPKFVMDALGIKSNGNFTRMLGMGATALGGIGATRAALKSRKEYNDANPYVSTGNRFKDGLNRALRSGAGMAASSALGGIASVSSGGHALLSTDKPTVKTGIDAMAKTNATASSRIKAGLTPFKRQRYRMETLFGGETSYDSKVRDKSANETANKHILQFKNTMEKKALEKDDLFVHINEKDANGNIVKTFGGQNGINYMEFMAHTEGAKNGNTESLKYFMDLGFKKDIVVTEEYEITSQVGTGIYREDGSEIMKDVVETKTHPVTKTVADWQGAQSYIDKIKDAQTQKHAQRVIAAVEKYESTKGTNNEDNTVFVKYGTEYNDYRLAADAVHDINLSVDFTKYSIDGADASKGDTVGLKQALGETNKKTTSILTDPEFKAGEVYAKENKNNT